MSDRNLVHYEEERLEHGPHWTLDIDRSSAGQPGLLITIRSKMHDPKYSGHPELEREMTIVVEDGNALLGPVLEWLEEGK